MFVASTERSRSEVQIVYLRLIEIFTNYTQRFIILVRLNAVFVPRSFFCAAFFFSTGKCLGGALDFVCYV